MGAMLKPVTKADVVRQTVDQVREDLEAIRQRLANMYATASVDSTAEALVEQELGDCLHVVRQACKRLRKSAVELLDLEQLPLPLE